MGLGRYESTNLQSLFLSGLGNYETSETYPTPNTQIWCENASKKQKIMFPQWPSGKKNSAWVVPLPNTRGKWVRFRWQSPTKNEHIQGGTYYWKGGQPKPLRFKKSNNMIWDDPC